MHWIVYVDLDAFYVSCELRTRPELIGRPVIVGADPSKGPSRGVVLSASYEARAFGVHSAQPVGQASRLCPNAVWLPPNFREYAAAARQVRELISRHATPISVFSIDEVAFGAETTDATEVDRLAHRVQEEIRRDLTLPSSIGVSASVTVAKIACDSAKPGGVRVVEDGAVAQFLAPLSVRSIPGIGPKTEKFLGEYGVKTIGDLARDLPVGARVRLGSAAGALVELARGRPKDRELPRDGGPRSRSVDRTFALDLTRKAEGTQAIAEMAEELAGGLTDERLAYQTVTVAVRWSDFTRTQRSRTLPTARTGAGAMKELGPRLFLELWEDETSGRGRAARTLSLRVERLRPETGRQLTLDPDAA